MRPEAFLLPAAGPSLGVVSLVHRALAEAGAAWGEPLGKALPRLEGAVDLALLSAVFLLFSLGLFELFVRKLDLPPGNALAVGSLGDLKAKLGQVIVMVLVVKFFEQALAFKPETALDLLLFAGGVALLSAALWLAKD